MRHRKTAWVVLTLSDLALSLATLAPDAAAQKKGGVLKVGNLGEPPTLDAHWTTATITEVLTNHIYEGLYSLDAKSQPIPMLAESMPAVSKDGLTYTFKLRQGIKFHNGKEMTSADVVASLNRWGQQSTYGKGLYARVAEVRGRGLMIGIECDTQATALRACRAALARGVILLPSGDDGRVLSVTPPLCIGREALEHALGILVAELA